MLQRRRRGHLRLRPARRVVRVDQATTTSPTSSPAPKGLTSAYAPDGRRCCSPTASPSALLAQRPHVPARRRRSAAIRSPPRVALKNLEIMEREDVIGNVRRNAGLPRGRAARADGSGTRSSATCAARATSGRSSWSRTAPRRRASRYEECDVAAARLPLARAARGGPDLPRRRPRRPGHPGLAAADLHARAHRRGGRDLRRRAAPRDGAHAAAEPWADRAHRRATSRALDRPRARAGRGGAGAEREVRWVASAELVDPTPFLERRRAAADDRPRARRRRRRAGPVRRAARRRAAWPGSASASGSATPSCRRRWSRSGRAARPAGASPCRTRRRSWPSPRPR